MGTRSLTFVHEDDGPAIICIYRQFDGYFSGAGDEIVSFLKGAEVVNGISVSTRPIFNGAGDLAARLVTYFKGGDADAAGNIYIEPADSSDGDFGTEFAYHIHCTVGQEPRLVATDVYCGVTVDAPVSQITWPQVGDDGEYIVAQPTVVDTSGPLSDDLRRALFAMFSRTFEDTSDRKRRMFTAMVLDRDDRISWSSASPDAITVNEGFRLLRALDAIEQTQLA